MSVTITVHIKRHTDRAVLVQYNEEDIWLLKSQIESVPIPAAGVGCELTISDWIAEQKNLTMDSVERYVVEPGGSSGNNFVVKDTNSNPVHIMCICGSARDANIIAASLELTKNKL